MPHILAITPFIARRILHNMYCTIQYTYVGTGILADSTDQRTNYPDKKRS